MSGKIVLYGIVALIVILAVPSVSAGNEIYFVPCDSVVPEGTCHNTTVAVRINTTDAIDTWQTNIAFDPNCINITDVTFPAAWESYKMFKHHGDHIEIGSLNPASGCQPLSDYTVATLKIHCEDCCKSPLNFAGGHMVSRFLFCSAFAAYPEANWTNGTVTCGEVEAGNETTTPTPTPAVRNSGSGGSGSRSSAPTISPSPNGTLSAPTPTPAPTPTIPPSPTESGEAKVTPTPTPEPEGKIPGFEIFFTCLALLIAFFLLLQMRGGDSTKKGWR